MRLNSIIFIVLLFVCCVGNAQAQIYTCKDANGKTIYTDSPSQCANAEEIKVDTLPTLVPTKPLAIPANNQSTRSIEDKDAYTELQITSPNDDATIRDNQGSLTINFRVAPALQTRKGHKYVVTVNGKEVYSGTSTIAALKNVDRGAQNIGVKVVDKDGSTKISAAPVKVTMQRFSSLQNTNGSNSNSGNTGNSNNSNQNTSNRRFPSLPRLNN